MMRRAARKNLKKNLKSLWPEQKTPKNRLLLNQVQLKLQQLQTRKRLYRKNQLRLTKICKNKSLLRKMLNLFQPKEENLIRLLIKQLLRIRKRMRKMTLKMRTMKKWKLNQMTRKRKSLA